MSVMRRICCDMNTNEIILPINQKMKYRDKKGFLLGTDRFLIVGSESEFSIRLLACFVLFVYKTRTC